MLCRFPSRALGTFVAICVAVALTLGATLVTSLIGAMPASAHTALVRITPGHHAVLIRAPTRVVLEFNEPVSTMFATVVVTTSAGESVASGKPTVLGGRVTQALSPNLASSGYRIAYRVVSDDGHPVTGQSDFTVKLAPTPVSSTPTPVPSASPDAASLTARSPASSQGGWLSRSSVPIAGAVGLVAIVGAGVLLWTRRRRH